MNVLYSRFHVDEVNQSSDRELTGNSTAVSSIESYVPHLPKKCCKFIFSLHPLLKLGFLLTGNLLVCWGIIYLLQKVLPKNYRQYLLGI
ncbi:hypothetical protein QUB56_18765 [Microcoleus sp. AR_TQ3_B6]|uniref:hypothetical protein n=1 Tax=Microcoleus sp. AR_TQ3_B6 TaxID=3055284 RepID=UPI002FD6BCBD